MNEEIVKYNKNGSIIYHKYSDGYEYWKEYDENNNLIYHKRSSGYKAWAKFNENNNEIYYKNSDGEEYWKKYDENNNGINITQQEFKQIERTKLYLNIKNSNRFEIMDI